MHESQASLTANKLMTSYNGALNQKCGKRLWLVMGQGCDLIISPANSQGSELLISYLYLVNNINIAAIAYQNISHFVAKQFGPFPYLVYIAVLKRFYRK